MIRMQTLLITTAVAIALPLTWAGAQTPSHGTKCGPVAFSNEKMAYVSMPCADGATCRVLDSCNGTCPGLCAQRCSTNTECPAACLCSGILSPENGGGSYCQGTACVP